MIRTTLGRALTAVAALSLILTGCAASPDAGTDAGPDSGDSTAAGSGDRRIDTDQGAVTDLDVLTVGLTYTPNIQFVPFYLAQDAGYFEELGLEVELRHHGQSEDLFGALQQGTEDVVYAGGDEIVQARSNGIDVLSIGTLYQEYPAALIVPADSDIRTAADIAGHSVGTPGPYGETWFALLSLLQQSGLSQQDVDIQHIGYTQQVALTSGKVDAVTGYVNNDAVQFERAGFPVRVIEVFPAGEAQLVGPALGTTQAAAQERGDELRLLLQALDRATQEVIADPQAAVDIAAAYIPTLTTEEARAAALATLQATIPLLETPAGQNAFTNDPATWQATVGFLGEQGLLGATPVTADQAASNDFLP